MKLSIGLKAGVIVIIIKYMILLIICYKNDITLKYNSEEERKRLQLMNVEEMSKDEIRKYLYVIFRGERFCSGLIMKNILNGKLKLLLEILIDSNGIV